MNPCKWRRIKKIKYFNSLFSLSLSRSLPLILSVSLLFFLFLPCMCDVFYLFLIASYFFSGFTVNLYFEQIFILVIYIKFFVLLYKIQGCDCCEHIDILNVNKMLFFFLQKKPRAWMGKVKTLREWESLLLSCQNIKIKEKSCTKSNL